jgi:osmoprotectant transport system ATP-binding protein
VQGSGLFPHLTVADNISLLPRLEGWEEGRAKLRLQQLAEMVQLAPKLLDRFPHELSGGQQQRAGLCRAMVLNPRLLLLDEPFGALDPLTRLDIHARFRRLQSLEPRTLLLVTHDMREAMSLAQHVVVLEKGRLLLQAGTAELQARSPGLDAEQLLLELLEELA